MSIRDNIFKIRENIDKLCLATGRKNDVRIVAVTKYVPVDRIHECLKYGINDIGESKVQELLKKRDCINPKPNYHFIGHLQTNKVKYIYDKVDLIQSLDRIDLANELEKRASIADITINLLIQINISKESTKSGIFENEVFEFIESLQNHKHLQIQGLMTIGSNTDDKAIIRSDFRKMYNLSEKIKSKHYERVNMDILSMGMTNDYSIAIEEGSNMVRIGTGIFGEREKMEG
ncbi:YggS family pyridoxal phosphate-dependent enzyme [Soehngenia saccharolytica]|nr:YggS family pyridoxal phosphate-dependent enzyme [Soehngenia saccharolytica]